MLDDALSRLSPATAADVLAVAELPDDVRGYEEIKRANVARVRARAAELAQRLAARS